MGYPPVDNPDRLLITFLRFLQKNSQKFVAKNVKKVAQMSVGCDRVKVIRNKGEINGQDVCLLPERLLTRHHCL
jgi:hypothetical protein